MLVLGLVLAGAAALAHAAEPIDPDRPDLTNGTATVGRGVVQIETGVEWRRTSGDGSPTERRLGFPLVLRVGLLDRLEARLESEPLVHLQNAESDTGFGDLKLGFKWGFFDAVEGDWKPAIGVLPFVKLPTADAPIGSERPDFGVTLLLSFNMPQDFFLDVNAGLTVVGQTHPNGYLAQGLGSASLQRKFLDNRLSTFVELFVSSPDERDGRGRFGGDVGAIYWLTPDLTVDTAIETTFPATNREFAVRAGLSARFGGKTR